MNPLLEQFLSESRECTQGISEKLMQLEKAPNDQDVIKELFRLVHTLKGNSGLFTYPEMTRVLHAGEDLLGMVRIGGLAYSQQLADRLLDAMDFFIVLCNEVEKTEKIDASRSQESAQVAEALRALMPVAHQETADSSSHQSSASSSAAQKASQGFPALARIAEATRLEIFGRYANDCLHWIAYTPTRECFFQGDDPLYSVRQTPGLLWGSVKLAQPLPPIAELDTYSCLLQFQLLSSAPREELYEHFRYIPDQVVLSLLNPQWLVHPEGGLLPPAAGEAKDESVETISGDAAEEAAAFSAILTAQQQILQLDDHPAWQAGRIKAVAAVLANFARLVGDTVAASKLEAALSESLASRESWSLLTWLQEHQQALMAVHASSETALQRSVQSPSNTDHGATARIPDSSSGVNYGRRADDGIKFGRRAEDNLTGPRSLKVDQGKVDRLMNLIGELVVSKNALPYLAQRAEAQYGVRELSREIKGQYSIINRIADEMQDAIMQVRMMTVSFIFQRFPRLVRDISRKLGKEVQLVLEGEQTEADKNIIESLADPLIHIVRNSLDHGLETPDIRRAQGKPEAGTLTIRAAQEADRVVISILDDGKGIDPEVIKRKAYEKGLIDEAALERMDDREAVNLIFAAGLSTAEVVSDLSGRGVGMDVVRSAVEKVNGTVLVTSEVGKGTEIRISLPLSMAVTQVMLIESDHQQFGVPMDHVVETVRVPRSATRAIKQSLTTVLRGRVVALKTLNHLLGITAQPRANADDELAVLLVQAGGGELGLIVDGFRETIGVIQKPLEGFLSSLTVYSGSALMGDGSVLMILNMREIL